GAVLARDDVGQAGVGAGGVVDVVAVVALLDALVGDAVAAKGGHARGRAGVVVEQVAVVALLDALVHEAVTAHVLGAEHRQAGVAVELVAVVAVLDAGLNVAVAAEGELAGRALVGGLAVAVVALLALLHDPVAAAAGQAHRVAAVGLVVVAVVAGLDADLQVAVAAAGQLTGVDAVVAVAEVAVVALLEALVHVAVAAGGDLAVGRARARGRVVRAEVALLAVADHTVATARLAVAVTAEVAGLGTVEGGEGPVVAGGRRRAGAQRRDRASDGERASGEAHAALSTLGLGWVKPNAGWRSGRRHSSGARYPRCLRACVSSVRTSRSARRCGRPGRRVSATARCCWRRWPKAALASRVASTPRTRSGCS